MNSSRTRAEEAGANEKYYHAGKTAKKIIKAYKRNNKNTLATEKEEAAHQAYVRELYTIIKKL